MRTAITFVVTAAFCLMLSSSAVITNAQMFEEDFSDPAAPDWGFYCPAGSCTIENQELHVRVSGSSGWGERLAALFQPSAENYRIAFDYKQRSWAGWLTIHFGRDGFPGAWDSHYYSLSMDGRGDVPPQ